MCVACVGWQVTVCDPIRQVTLRSSVMDFSIKSYTFLYLYLFTFNAHAMRDSISSCFGLSFVIFVNIHSLNVLRRLQLRKKLLKSFICGVYGCSRSSLLVPRKARQQCLL